MVTPTSIHNAGLFRPVVKNVRSFLDHTVLFLNKYYRVLKETTRSVFIHRLYVRTSILFLEYTYMYYVDEAEEFATVHGVRVSLVFQLFYTVGCKTNYEKDILML